MFGRTILLMCNRRLLLGADEKLVGVSMSDDVVQRFRSQTQSGVGEQASPVPQTRALIRNHLELAPLFRIIITNLLLTIATLGIYRFWAKVRLRRYLWGHVEILGDRLEYTGTGKELFLGFIFVFFLVLLPFFGVFALLEAVMEDAPDATKAARDSLQTILIVVLIGVAFYRARRYRLTRTHWRGIYGNQTGSAFKYGMLALGCYFLTTASLGLAWPVCSVWLKQYQMDHTWIGNQKPQFTPKASKLYGPFLIAWFGTIAYFVAVVAAFAAGIGFGEIDRSTIEESPGATFTLIGLLYTSFIPGLALFLWYRGKAYNHFVSSTRFLGHDITSAITGAGFAGLTLANMLLMLFTLGLAAPLVYRRYLNFVERTVGLSGSGDFSALMQSEIEKPGVGEGLADAFDVGAI